MRNVSSDGAEDGHGTAHELRLRPPPVPADFWHTAEMQAALATRHMGKVLRAFRTHPFHGKPISQEIAAGWIDLTQTQLSRIEAGSAPDSLTKLTYWVRILGVPPGLLWFQMPGRASESSQVLVPYEPNVQEVAWQSDSQGHVHELLPLDVAAHGADQWLDDMNRRELLRLLCMAGPLMGVVGTETVDWERVEYGNNRPYGIDGAALAEYAALNSHLWRVFVLSQSKGAVFPLVRSHLDVLTNSLQQSTRTETHRQLCRLVGDLFQLAGKICF